MKRVCIHQPDFLPYLGFFHRLLFVDLFIVLDDVQFLRKGSGWHNRDKIKTRSGETWLTLSIQKGKMDQKINEVMLSKNTGWIQKNLNLLMENYRKAPCFSEYFPEIKEIYSRGFLKMIDMNMAFLGFFFDIFDLNVPIVFSSELNAGGHKNEKLINLLKAVNGTHYLSGTGARDYMKVDLFEKEGIAVEWQKFQHPVYPQLHGEFLPYLSCIDLLFNCGAGSREILRSCQNEQE